LRTDAFGLAAGVALSAGSIVLDVRAACGSRGLSAGFYGSVTTNRYAGPTGAENPPAPRPPGSWGGAIGVDEGSATVGLRAICTQ
jgi:hypothetical protein